MGYGWLLERSNRTVSKTVVRANVPRVRIPHHPPFFLTTSFNLYRLGLAQARHPNLKFFKPTRQGCKQIEYIQYRLN